MSGDAAALLGVAVGMAGSFIAGASFAYLWSDLRRTVREVQGDLADLKGDVEAVSCERIGFRDEGEECHSSRGSRRR